MNAECPLGHTENLSYREVRDRLREGDFECRGDGGECIKSISYEIDERFWEMYADEILQAKR